MNRTETPVGADPETLLAGPMAEPSGAPGRYSGSLEHDGPLETEAVSDTPENSSCDSANASGEEVTERETFQAGGHLDSNAPTVAEVGAHFAAEIAGDAVASLRAAARLGPKKVLLLLK